MQAGIVLELIVFAFALSYKMRKIEVERKKSNEKLILQLKENEKLQTKLNRELEKLVEKRTAEIKLKNKILEQQYEEISAIRDEIESQRNILTKSNNKQSVISRLLYLNIVQHNLALEYIYHNPHPVNEDVD